MRLRSSKFVFLLLLACSLQTAEEHALRFVTGIVSGRASDASQQRAMASAVRGHDPSPLMHFEQRTRQIRLDAASRAAQNTPWSMRRPALESTAIVSFTGFLRG